MEISAPSPAVGALSARKFKAAPLNGELNAEDAKVFCNETSHGHYIDGGYHFGVGSKRRSY